MTRNSIGPTALMVPAAAILLLGLTSHARAQGAGINFKGDFDMVVDCTEPRAVRNFPLHGSVNGVLNLDKSGSADLSVSGSSFATSLHFEGRLGQGPAAAPGGSSQFHVVGPNRLRLTWDLPNNQLNNTIVISGQRCSSIVDVRRKSGRVYTLHDGSTYHYCSRLAITHTSCSVY
jgi:hypothetical protein